jgi:transcriptional regulator with XRE-family HTH domain
MTKQWAQGLGRVIRSRRQALGLSQAALAKRAGISQPYLSQVEAGARGEAQQVKALLGEVFDELSGRWLSHWAVRSPRRAVEGAAGLR